MYPSPFEYESPSSVDEALGLLERYGDDAKVLAGGQSLIPMMNLRLLRPRVLVDVNALDGGVPRVDNGTLTIPAFTRQRTVERSALVQEHCPILPDAIHYIGNVRVRNRGTIGGNLAHADPSSELSCAALALGGYVNVAGPKGTRSVQLRNLFVSYLTTSLDPAELIMDLSVPVIGSDTGWAFLEMARRAGEFAIANVACLMSVDPVGGECTGVSLVLGGVSDTPLDVSGQAEELLVGRKPFGQTFDDVARRAQDASDPRDDVHASAEYRRKVVRIYARRALELAYRRAQDSDGL